jgi:chromosome transmission fidelity protein 18
MHSWIWVIDTLDRMYSSKMRPKNTTSAKDKQDPSEPVNKRLRMDEMDIADKVEYYLSFTAYVPILICSLLQPPVDFFGRLITVPSASSTKAAARKNVEKKYRVTYRYTEGTSAAVRKPVKVRAFL